MQIVEIIKKKWYIFLTIGLISGIFGYVYAYFSKPQYQSRLTFTLDGGSGESGLSGALNLASQLGLGGGSNQNMFEGDNILEVIKSRRIIESVLLTPIDINGTTKTLADYYISISNFKSKFNNTPRLKNIHFTDIENNINNQSILRDSILFELYKDVSKNVIEISRPDKKNSIYALQVTSNDEKFSKIFTDKIIEASGTYYIKITSQKDSQIVDVLEKRVESLRNKLNDGVFSKAINQDNNLNPAFAVGQANSQIQQFNILSYSEAYKELFKTLELARYQYLKKIPLLQIIDQADYPMEMKRPGKLKFSFFFIIISILLTLLIIQVLNQYKKFEK